MLLWTNICVPPDEAGAAAVAAIDDLLWAAALSNIMPAQYIHIYLTDH